MKNNNDEKVYRLAKPVKTGLLHLVFSRFLVILVLLAAQVLLMVTLYRWLVDYLKYLTVVQTVFTLVMIVYLFNSAMDCSAKLTWMLIIAVMPLPGAALLYFTRMNFGHRKVKARVAQITAETAHALEQPPGLLRTLMADESGTDDLVTYLNRSGCFPVFDGTDAHYFPSGEDCFEAMIEELEKAEKFIFLEYFIIEEGYMWGRVLEVLTRKAAQGVDVRVMYDGMCELSHLPYHYTRLLEEQGIRAKIFTPILPVVTSQYNYRDHRKILVIDGRTAFTGGMNLADEYINRRKRFGYWKDTAVMLRGKAVKGFTLAFLQMWNLDEDAPEYRPWLTEEYEIPGARGYVLPFTDNPMDDERVGETVYMDILYRANDYVHIMTPYLILDDQMETALIYAAQRGVNVQIILPGIPDKKVAYSLAKSHYARLTSAGVQLFEYTPGFLHAKVCVSDDRKAMVGSINLDYRSFYHHYECAAYLYLTDCIPWIEADFQQTLLQCRPVTKESIAAERPFYKIVGWLAKFIAPLM